MIGGTGGLLLAPMPKKLSMGDGSFNITGRLYIRLDAENPQSLIPAAKQTGLELEITASPKAPKDKTGIVIRLDESRDIAPEGYKLTIRPNVIEITASTPSGAFYGACTLAQIARQYGSALPCLTISDWPDFPNRGVMLDISRDMVPTMESLYRLVDMLASWKINQFQLYTEHTFAYPAHPTVWRDASPMTGEQILDLDAYCKSRFIELVPNQNSFGHMERWLKFDEYRPMAESPDGGDTVWGYRSYPISLCPTDRRCVPFLAGLYNELLPHFSSKFFNVGCDETADLGYGRSKKLCKERGTGRVYLDFLLNIYSLVKDQGRTMMFWDDIIINYPELIPELPRDMIALEWGYEHDHPFADRLRKFKSTGIPFYVCPGTSNWGSIAGRTDNAIGNITSAATSGLANGAIGILNTSWGDYGHWDPLPVSYLGFLVGAMTSWNVKSDAKESLSEKLSLHAFGDPTGKTGRAFYDLGNVYKAFEKRVSTVPWLVLFQQLHDPKIFEGLTAGEFDNMDRELRDIYAAFQGDKMIIPDASAVRSDLQFLFDILHFSADVGRMCLGGPTVKDLQSRTSMIKDEHRQDWLLRNRPGGLEDSTAKLALGQGAARVRPGLRSSGV